MSSIVALVVVVFIPQVYHISSKCQAESLVLFDIYGLDFEHFGPGFWIVYYLSYELFHLDFGL